MGVFILDNKEIEICKGEPLYIRIEGKVVGKQRARVVRRGGKSITYTPGGTSVWEEQIQWQSLEQKRSPLWDEPLAIKMWFVLSKPKTVKRFWPSVKPDYDNLEKSITDALEKIIYTNDSRIVRSEFLKMYGEPERAEIVVYTLDDVIPDFWLPPSMQNQHLKEVSKYKKIEQG